MSVKNNGIVRRMETEWQRTSGLDIDLHKSQKAFFTGLAMCFWGETFQWTRSGQEERIKRSEKELRQHDAWL